MKRLAKSLLVLALTLSLGVGVRAVSPYSASCNPTAIGTVYETGLTYVANGSGNTVSVIGGANVIAIIPVGPSPRLIAIDQSTETFNVLHRDYEHIDPRLYGVSVGSGTRATRYAWRMAENPTSIAAWQYNVYVTDAAHNWLKILYIFPWEIYNPPTDAYPIDIAIDPETGILYVANRDSDTVSILMAGDDPAGTVPVGQRPIDVEVDPERSFVYVANAASNDVSIIFNGEVMGTAPAETPGATAINPSTGHVYIISRGPNKVVTVLRPGGYPMGTVSPDFYPEVVEADPVTGDVYVAGWKGLSPGGMQTAYIAVLHGTEVVATSPVIRTQREYSGQALHISVDPTTGYVYVSEYNSGTVTILRNTEILATIPACEITLHRAYLPLIVQND